MNETMNYDPNMNFCGRRSIQVVRLIFGQWDYRKAIEVEIYGNYSGLAVIEYAISTAYEDFFDEEKNATVINMKNQSGDTLECEDEYRHGDDWLKGMVISAEIISISQIEDTGDGSTS